MAERLAVATLPAKHASDDLVGARLGGVVAEVIEQGEGVLEVGVGIAITAQLGVGAGEAVVGVGLPGQVGEASGCAQGGVLGGGEVVPVPPSVEEVLKGPGQLPGVGVEPVARSLVDGGEQHEVFSGEPGNCLLVVEKVSGGDAGLGWNRCDRSPVWLDQQSGVKGGVQVMVQ